MFTKNTHKEAAEETMFTCIPEYVYLNIKANSVLIMGCDAVKDGSGYGFSFYRSKPNKCTM